MAEPLTAYLDINQLPPEKQSLVQRPLSRLCALYEENHCNYLFNQGGGIGLRTT